MSMHPLLALASVVVGGRAVLRGVRALSGAASARRLGAVALGEGPHGQSDEDAPDDRGVREARWGRSDDIDDRIDAIVEQIRRGSLDPKVANAARWAVSRKCRGSGGRAEWCAPPSDYAKALEAIYWSVQDPASPYAIRYTNDHATVDQFEGAGYTLRTPAADCDGMVIAFGSRARAIGFPLWLILVETTNSPGGFDHICLAAGTPPLAPAEYVIVDLGLDRAMPFGWSLEGLREVISTGRQSGKVRNAAIRPV